MPSHLSALKKDDTIIATSTTDASIYGLGGNDFISVDRALARHSLDLVTMFPLAGLLDTDDRKLYRGSGNNIFIGGNGNSLMAGGKGNDQFYAGSGHDTMIGGGGANFFDCGLNGNG